MKQYIVAVREIYVSNRKVIARNKEEAVRMALRGEYLSEYVEYLRADEKGKIDVLEDESEDYP